MNARRDKQKADRRVQNPTPEAVAVKSAGAQHPVLKKLGDFFFDVAKLIFGGVVLAGLMKQDIDYWLLASTGMVSVVGLNSYWYCFN